MYLSLIKKLSLGSLQVYKSFKNKWGFYSYINKFHDKKFYIDNIVLNQILSGKEVSNQAQLFLSKHLDVYHFIFNMYHTFFKNNKFGKLKFYLPCILNSLNKYAVGDFFDIDLFPTEEKVRIISNLVVGKSFVYTSYEHIISTKESVLIKDKNNFRDLINYYYSKYDRSSYKSKQSIDLQDLSLNIEKIYEIIKENYLKHYHFNDVITLAEKYGLENFSFILSARKFLFYHTFSLTFDFRLSAIPATNRVMLENNLEGIKVVFFITLDKNIYYYKDSYGKYEYGNIKDERINILKKNLFNSKYVVKKRNKKIDVS